MLVDVYFKVLSVAQDGLTVPNPAPVTDAPGSAELSKIIGVVKTYSIYAGLLAALVGVVVAAVSRSSGNSRMQNGALMVVGGAIAVPVLMNVIPALVNYF